MVRLECACWFFFEFPILTTRFVGVVCVDGWFLLWCVPRCTARFPVLPAPLLLYRERDRETGVVFLVIGSLCFLPGSYASYNLWHAWRGTPGFHFHQSALRALVLGRLVRFGGCLFRERAPFLVLTIVTHSCFPFPRRWCGEHALWGACDSTRQWRTSTTSGGRTNWVYPRSGAAAGSADVCCHTNTRATTRTRRHAERKKGMNNNGRVRHEANSFSSTLDARTPLTYLLGQSSPPKSYPARRSGPSHPPPSRAD